MIKISAGSLHNYRIDVPNEGVRPTMQRVRESIFATIQNLLPAAHCVDLFAGSGVLGFEALSRGAQHCTFIDNSPHSCHYIQQNIIRLKLQEQSRVIQQSVYQTVPSVNGQNIQLFFADPPYFKGNNTNYLTQFISKVLHAPLLVQAKADSLLVLETTKLSTIPSSEYWVTHKQKKYGKTQVCFLFKK